MINISELNFADEEYKQYKQELLGVIKEKSVLYGDFTLASGQKSSYYLDTRITTLSAKGLSLVSYVLYSIYRKQIESGDIYAVAGPALGACSIVSGLAHFSYLAGNAIDALFVRKENKDHGTSKTIEGSFRSGEKVLMLEDVITSGGSVIKAIKKVQEAGGIVSDLICVILRDPKGAQNIKEQTGVNVISVFDVEEIIQ